MSGAGAPLVSPLSPQTRRAPASSTSVTLFSSPGSNRTAVPAGTLRRMPNAFARSNESARLTSKKWKCEPTWIGRSPVLLTVSSIVRRPSFATTSPSASRYSPGITLTPPSTNRVMHGHELRPVGERAFHLDLVDHFRHALHHVAAGEDRRAELHQLGHRAAVADTFQDLRGDERQRLRMIELEATTAPPARQLRRGEDQKLFLLARCQVHRRASGMSGRAAFRGVTRRGTRSPRRRGRPHDRPRG